MNDAIKITMIIFIWILSLATITLGTILSIRLIKHLRIKREVHDERHQTVDYSREIIEFIRYLSMQISVLRYREFADGIQLEKVNRNQIQELVKNIAVEVNNAINRDTFSLSETILTESFYVDYMISTISNSVKKLMEDGIEAYEQ